MVKNDRSKLVWRDRGKRSFNGSQKGVVGNNISMIKKGNRWTRLFKDNHMASLKQVCQRTKHGIGANDHETIPNRDCWKRPFKRSLKGIVENHRSAILKSFGENDRSTIFQWDRSKLSFNDPQMALLQNEYIWRPYYGIVKNECSTTLKYDSRKRSLNDPTMG